LSLRALNPIYDIATFIKAIPLILQEFKEARFIIVGDGIEKANLIRLVQDLGVTDSIRFTGRLSNEDLERYTASADIYVSTSLSDGGLAASTAEAMASAVPVVITDFGNNAEWIEHGRAGCLFPLRDYTALANNVLYLLKNPEKAFEMSSLGKEIIFERNNWHKEMGKINLMYQGMIQNI
jgi:glycosyltransferase involved in cell wall biosynthesis